MEGIVFGNGKFGYRDLPKVASTSIKAAIYQFEVDEVFRREKAGMHIHVYMRRNNKGDISVCEKKFVVVRDPVERFLSAYKNRVLFHRELSEPFIRQKFLHHYLDIPYFTPGIGQFIDHLEDYLLIKPIFHHCRPIVELFCGQRLEDFTHVYKIENLSRFEKDLSKLTGNEVTLDHWQTGGKKYSLRDLTKIQIEKLIEFYKRDYALLEGFYSVNDLWNKWRGDKHSPDISRTVVMKCKTKHFIKEAVNKTFR